SHRGPDNPNPPEYDPQAVFERLFGRLDPRDRSVLDVVAEDARALGARLGGHDRRRLDQHFQNIRELEKRLAAPPPRCGMRAGARLKHPGVHYRSDSGENASKVLLSVLRAAGVPLKRFGKKGGLVEDGLGAIEI